MFDATRCTDVFGCLSVYEAKDALSVADTCYLENRGVHFQPFNRGNQDDDPYEEAVVKEVMLVI